MNKHKCTLSRVFELPYTGQKDISYKKLPNNLLIICYLYVYSSIRSIVVCKYRDSNMFGNHILNARMVQSVEWTVLIPLPISQFPTVMQAIGILYHSSILRFKLRFCFFKVLPNIYNLHTYFKLFKNLDEFVAPQRVCKCYPNVK